MIHTITKNLINRINLMYEGYCFDVTGAYGYIFYSGKKAICQVVTHCIPPFPTHISGFGLSWEIQPIEEPEKQTFVINAKTKNPVAVVEKVNEDHYEIKGGNKEIALSIK